MGKIIGNHLPNKLKARLMLVSSGLKLNQQKWIKAKNCMDELHEIIHKEVKNWPNVVISTALIREKKFGSSPLIKPCNPKQYLNRNFLEKEIDKLKAEYTEYNGNKEWDENDYLRLFSSPLNINHLFVGVSVHFDVSNFMKEGWGRVRSGFPVMPIVIEVQQGTWPRYFNISKSDRTRETFFNFNLNNPFFHWKHGISLNDNALIIKSLSETLEYICSFEQQIKIIRIARIMNFKWIGFDAQYIDRNDLGFQEGFAIYDFVGF